MKVFVINLERSTIRRESIQRQLDAAGIEFEFIKAVDGATLTDEYLAEICNFEELNKRPHLLHKGMYGCILSHYSAYTKIVAEGLPCALVLEDDVVIQPGLKAALVQLEASIRHNEAILLFSQNNYTPTVFSKQDTEPLSGPYRLSFPMEPWALGSAAGYVISQAAAQGMVDYVLPIHEGPDVWFSYYRDEAISDLRCVTPFLVKPAGFNSDIDYVKTSSFAHKVLQLIRKKRVFPFAQLLDYRRKQMLNKSAHYSFSPERSPLAREAELGRVTAPELA